MGVPTPQYLKKPSPVRTYATDGHERVAKNHVRKARWSRGVRADLRRRFALAGSSAIPSGIAQAPLLCPGG